MNLSMRIFTLGGVVAVVVAALLAGVLLSREAERSSASAATYVEEIAELHAVQAEVAVLRSQRRQLVETAVSGQTFESLAKAVLVDPGRYSLRVEETRLDSQLTLERVDVGLTAVPAATLAALVEAVAGVSPPYRLSSASLKATQGKGQSVDGSVSFERVR